MYKYRVTLKCHNWGFANSGRDDGYVGSIALEEVRTLRAAKAKAAELKRNYYKKNKTDCCDVEIVDLSTNKQVYKRRYGKENKNRPTRKADHIIIKDYPGRIDVYAEFGEDDEYGMDCRIMSIDVTRDNIEDESDVYSINDLIEKADCMITEEQAEEIREAIIWHCHWNW